MTNPKPTPLSPADRLHLAPAHPMVSQGHLQMEHQIRRLADNLAGVAVLAGHHELAAILRERHGGSSQVADWLDGVGCHTSEAGQAVHP